MQVQYTKVFEGLPGVAVAAAAFALAACRKMLGFLRRPAGLEHTQVVRLLRNPCTSTRYVTRTS